jgi:hypothetical protein
VTARVKSKKKTRKQSAGEKKGLTLLSHVILPLLEPATVFLNVIPKFSDSGCDFGIPRVGPTKRS